MSKGYGFFSDVTDGMQAYSNLVLDKKRAEAADIAAQRDRLALSDAQMVRDNNAAVVASVKNAVTPQAAAVDPAQASAMGMPGDTEMAAPEPQKKAPLMHEAYAKVAKEAFARGDVANAEKFMGAAATQKTAYVVNSFNDAYQRGDLAGMLAVLNPYPNGQKYSASIDPQTGEVTAMATDMEGNQLGQPQKFKNVRAVGAFVQGQMNPGDIRKQIMDEEKASMEVLKTKSEIGKNNASTDGQKIANVLEETYGEQERAGKIGLTAAQTGSANANAAQSYASAGQAGVTPEMKNFGFRQRLSPEQQIEFDAKSAGRGGADSVVQDPSVMAAQRALIEAATDPVKRSTLTPEQLATAQALLTQAKGPGIMSKKTGAPVARSGESTSKPIDALSLARDAIAKGAPKEKVIERLRQSGIDPKGL